MFQALTQICLMVQLGGTGRIPAGATATIELSGPDARVTNNPGYYQHSAESKALAIVGVSMSPTATHCHTCVCADCKLLH
jgi:hypothetical protein